MKETTPPTPSFAAADYSVPVLLLFLCVDRTEQVKEETRIMLRRSLKQAQRSGKLDEVEALQTQLAHLEEF